MYSVHGVVRSDRSSQEQESVSVSGKMSATTHRSSSGSATTNGRKMMNHSSTDVPDMDAGAGDSHVEAEVKHQKVEKLQVRIWCISSCV